MEHTKKENPLYCIIVGQDEIYGVTYNQLQSLYQTIRKFIDREKSPFNCNIEEYGKSPVHIHKSIMLFADKEKYFIEYSLHTVEGDIECMSAEQLKNIAFAILDFLKQYGENGDRQIRWDLADSPPDEQKKINFEIKNDNRHSQFQTVPCITKSINQIVNETVEINYHIGINEMVSPDLSFKELIILSQRLGILLKSLANSLQ